MDELLIIVPVYNNLDLTIGTIASMVKCTKNAFEIIIVDDCSTDATQAYFANYSDTPAIIHYVRNEINSGVNASWNVGLKKAMELEGSYVCISNNDILYSDNWDGPLLKALEEELIETYKVFDRDA